MCCVLCVCVCGLWCVCSVKCKRCVCEVCVLCGVFVCGVGVFVLVLEVLGIIPYPMHDI